MTPRGPLAKSGRLRFQSEERLRVTPNVGPGCGDAPGRVTGRTGWELKVSFSPILAGSTPRYEPRSAIHADDG
jgi:hypothetical protein